MSTDWNMPGDFRGHAPERHAAGRPDVYTIHVGAPLGPEWIDWFDGVELVARDDRTGLIVAPIRDQAMLFGLLIQLRDLGVPLLGLYPGRDHGRPAR